ncbi:MAG: hypothetical protein ACRD5H_10570 [Nitrososphaerales archaeon]
MEIGVLVALLSITGMVIVATTMEQARAEDPVFGQPIKLTNTASVQFPDIAASGEYVYVVWEGNRNVDPGSNFNAEIFFRVSDDGGETFGSITNLSNIYGFSTGPEVAASGNNVYVAWEEALPIECTNGKLECLGNFEIYFRASNDNGSTFGTTVNLSNNAMGSENPRIVASGNNAYVVWQDKSPQQNGRYNVLFRTINADGTLGNVLDISKSGSSVVPKIAVSGNYLHVVWSAAVYDEHFDIAYTRSPPTASSPEPTPPSDPSPAPTPPSPDPSPTTLEVTIDVKPSSTTNTVNCSTQKGSISVGLYTEDGFDAQDVDISTIELQGVDAKKYLLKDLDSDGDLDGLARFSKAALCESGEILSLSGTQSVTLAGSTEDGDQFEGDDIIRFRR